MSGFVTLDWIDLAVSLFITLVLIWLGLTVVFNAERRTWGMWLAGGGLLAGGVFFICHTALLSLGAAVLTPGLDFWWRVGWMLIIALPFAWYLVILWYSGCWEERRSPLWMRHRIWFAATVILLVWLVGLLLVNSLPSLIRLIEIGPTAVLAAGATPVLLLIYPVYAIACMGLSIDALRHPLPSARMMGDRARQRARPWLIRASIFLLMAGLLVGGVLYWMIEPLIGWGQEMRQAGIIQVLVWFDLAIAGCISIAVIMLGQAITEYEIFTGKSLPRRGLTLLWQRILILAAGYSLVIGWSLAIQLRPIYILLLSTIILACFFALLGWRQFAERERLMEQLRPFISSQRLYDQALLNADPDQTGIRDLFTALCQGVLGVKKAVLIPRGPMAAVVGDPIFFPVDDCCRELPAWITTGFGGNFIPGHSFGSPAPADDTGGYQWGVPLWSQRTLTGILILGEKNDRGLYTQEEIAVAQSAGEQILDTIASAELARRLMRLQRQQMVESQVFDRQLRRSLHDDILPRVHEAILTINNLRIVPDTEKEQIFTTLTDLHRRIAVLLRGLKSQADMEIGRQGVLFALKHVIEEDLAGSFEQVDWSVDPGAETLLSTLSPVTAEVLYYAAREVIRNAASHASGSNPHPILRISVLCESGLRIRIEDNGGKMVEKSLEDLKGSGNGLILHSTMMSIIGGSLQVESVEGEFTRVILELPRSAPVLMGTESPNIPKG